MESGVRQRAESNAQVKPMCRQIKRVITDFQLHFHLWVLREERTQGRADVTATEPQRRVDPNQAFRRSPTAMDQLLDLIDLRQVAGMVLLLGVDRFMSEARAITNTIGNGVGTMAIAKWVGALDTVKMNKALNGDVEEEKSATVDEANRIFAHSAVGEGGVLPSLKKASRA